MSKPSAMSSVWETLNKMKERQKAAEQSNSKHKRHDNSRKQALQLFESALTSSIQSHNLDGATLLTTLFSENQSPDSPIRHLIHSHKQRLSNPAALPAELTAIRTTLTDLSANLSMVSMKISETERSVKRL